jgi:hypothetical protein
MAAHQVLPLSLFPIVLSSPLEMSRRYLRQCQDSSSDDENEEDSIATLHAAQAQHEHMRGGGRSVPERDHVHRDREVAHRTLYSDYFSENPTYGPTFFRRRFAISSLSFLFLVFELVFTCNFPYWCLFAQVLDVLFSVSSYSACRKGT